MVLIHLDADHLLNTDYRTLLSTASAPCQPTRNGVASPVFPTGEVSGGITYVINPARPAGDVSERTSELEYQATLALNPSSPGEEVRYREVNISQRTRACTRRHGFLIRSVLGEILAMPEGI